MRPFLILLSAPAISDCLPACIATHPLSLSLSSGALTLSFRLFPAHFSFEPYLFVIYLGFFSRGCCVYSPRAFGPFVVLFICDTVAYSLLFFALVLFACPGCTFHEDDFSIKCPKHEVRKLLLNKCISVLVSISQSSVSMYVHEVCLGVGTCKPSLP